MKQAASDNQLMCVSLLTISRLLTEFHLPRLPVPENKKQEEHFPTLHSVRSQGVCVEFRVWLDNSLNFLTLLNQPLYKYLLLHWLLQLWRFKWNQQHWQGYLPLPFSIIQLNNSKATPGSEWEWSLYPTWCQADPLWRGGESQPVWEQEGFTQISFSGI